MFKLQSKEQSTRNSCFLVANTVAALVHVDVMEHQLLSGTRGAAVHSWSTVNKPRGSVLIRDQKEQRLAHNIESPFLEQIIHGSSYVSILNYIPVPK